MTAIQGTIQPGLVAFAPLNGPLFGSDVELGGTATEGRPSGIVVILICEIVVEVVNGGMVVISV
jgi:hypothetical protein